MALRRCLFRGLLSRRITAVEAETKEAHVCLAARLAAWQRRHRRRRHTAPLSVERRAAKQPRFVGGRCCCCHATPRRRPGAVVVAARVALLLCVTGSALLQTHLHSADCARQGGEARAPHDVEGRAPSLSCGVSLRQRKRNDVAVSSAAVLLSSRAERSPPPVRPRTVLSVVLASPRAPQAAQGATARTRTLTRRANSNSHSTLDAERDDVRTSTSSPSQCAWNTSVSCHDAEPGPPRATATTRARADAPRAAREETTSERACARERVGSHPAAQRKNVHRHGRCGRARRQARALPRSERNGMEGGREGRTREEYRTGRRAPRRDLRRQWRTEPRVAQCNGMSYDVM